MHPISPQECSRIAQDLQIRKVQVETVVQLLDEGNTIPFLACYRKERTGGLSEETLRQIQNRIDFVRQIQERKQTILKSVEHQGKLTSELREAILAADTLRRLEDLYLPYKPKKRGPAASARERGLEPLALAIWHSDPAVGNLEELLPTLVNPEKSLHTVDDVRAGVGQILMELMAESAEVRAPVRALLWEAGKLTAARSDKVPEGRGIEYQDYFQFTESARRIPPHRILALNRGEKDGVLRIQLEYPKDRILETAQRALAELMLRMAGRLSSALPPVPPTAAPEAAPSSPPAEPAAPCDIPPGAVAECVAPAAPPLDVGFATPAPEAAAAAMPPASPEPAPLVASMEPGLPRTMTGEPLAPGSEFRSPHVGFLRSVLEEALNRVLLPSLEREIRRELTDEAEGHAVAVFARNLRSLLLQPPLQSRRVLAIDPGFRAGCKLAALDEAGNLLDHAMIHPFGGTRRGKDRTSTTPNPPQAAVSAPIDIGVVAHALEAAPVIVAAVPVAIAPASTDSVASLAASVADAPTPETSAAGAEALVAPAPPAAAPQVDKRAEAKSQLRELIQKHRLQVIALGNGTGCREVEEIVSELIATDLPEVSYVLVNEAGVSVYATSQTGREEFPTFDPALRSAISLGRRLQDPLSELVKVDAQHIGVGLYQHDMGRKELRESLDAVVESCVNQVGVDVNTASVPLLRHVSGLNQMVAREIVAWRKQHGPFTSREQLLQVGGLGPQRWSQATGFLKIPGAALPLDRTWIHPESYGLAEKILGQVGLTSSVLDDATARDELKAKLGGLNVDEVGRNLGVSGMTVRDVLEGLCNPGRDPREDLPPPIFKKGILKLEDLQPGMELKGTVLNVVDFGAFVDIGLKDSGLVHISQMANRYIRSPYEVVAVNDVVSVWVLTVDKERHRVSLTMIQPGTDRKPPERRPRRDDGSRPPRGRRQGGPPAGGEQGQLEGVGQGTPHGGAPGDRGQRRPPRGRHFGRGPGRPSRSEPAPATAPAETDVSRPPPRAPLPPRRPRREPPKPKLTQAALEGKVPLRTFGELSALFAAKKEQETPAPPPAPPVAVETAASAADPSAEQPNVLSTQPAPPAVSSEAPPESDNAPGT